MTPEIICGVSKTENKNELLQRLQLNLVIVASPEYLGILGIERVHLLLLILGLLSRLLKQRSSSPNMPQHQHESHLDQFHIRLLDQLDPLIGHREGSVELFPRVLLAPQLAADVTELVPLPVDIVPVSESANHIAADIAQVPTSDARSDWRGHSC